MSEAPATTTTSTSETPTPAEPSLLGAAPPAPTPPPDKPATAEGAVAAAPAAPTTPETPIPPAPLDPNDLVWPEGARPDAAQMGEAAKFFKEAGVTDKKQAQSLLDYHLKQVTDTTNGLYKAWEKQQTEWQAEIRKEYGDKLTATNAKIAQIIDTYGGQDLRDALNQTGAGNNPAVYRAFARIAEAFTEGGHVRGSPTATSRPSVESVFYPNQPQG